MSKHLKILRPLVAAALISSAAVAETTVTADSVVATVNGQEITLGHMMMTREALPDEYKALPDDVLFKGILDQIVQQTILAQGLEGKETTRIRFALENERRLMTAGEAINRMIASDLTEEGIQASYEAKYGAGFEAPTEYNAAHILVPTQEEAVAIREEVLGGADFAETAKAKSTGPSGPSGGSLGWFGPGAMVKPFEDAVVGMEIGGVSEPIQTQFGWHIITLYETRPQAAPTLDMVREELVSDLQQTIVEEQIAKLTETAQIDQTIADGMDPSVLKQTDLLDAPAEAN